MQDSLIQRARPYLAELSAMTGEAARSDDPRVVTLALRLVDRQPKHARELLHGEHLEASEADRPEVDRFLSWLSSLETEDE